MDAVIQAEIDRLTIAGKHAEAMELVKMVERSKRR